MITIISTTSTAILHHPPVLSLRKTTTLLSPPHHLQFGSPIHVHPPHTPASSYPTNWSQHGLHSVSVLLLGALTQSLGGWDYWCPAKGKGAGEGGEEEEMIGGGAEMDILMAWGDRFVGRFGRGFWWEQKWIKINRSITRTLISRRTRSLRGCSFRILRHISVIWSTHLHLTESTDHPTLVKFHTGMSIAYGKKLS